MKIFSTVTLATTLLLIGVTTVPANEAPKENVAKVPYGKINEELLPIAYSGNETLRFELAYTGGIKLGEMLVKVSAVAGTKDDFEIHATIATVDSTFDVIYPVNDIHVTRVSGKERLPYFYEVWQEEGFGYQAHRVTSFNQNAARIQYQKNESAPRLYEIEGPIHNEFSSFFSSRLMDLTVGSSFLVPTFADKRKVDVEVKVLEKEMLKKTILGTVETVQVSPILKFNGLYDKRGDTTIWYTNDECRVPVKIVSKIKLGSVTSKLLSYSNPDCKRYSKIAHTEK